jgi:hypothetical protein
MKNKIIPILIFLMIVNGCKTQKIASPDCGIDPAHMNNEIRSGLMAEWNSYKKNDVTQFFVRGKNKLPITLPIDLNLKIFFLDPNTQTWNPIKNKTIILGNEAEEVLKFDKNITIRSILIDLPKSPESVKVIYCVSGKTEEGVPVGASGGFTLYP